MLRLLPDGTPTRLIPVARRFAPQRFESPRRIAKPLLRDALTAVVA